MRLAVEGIVLAKSHRTVMLLRNLTTNLHQVIPVMRTNVVGRTLEVRRAGRQRGRLSPVCICFLSFSLADMALASKNLYKGRPTGLQYLIKKGCTAEWTECFVIS